MKTFFNKKIHQIHEKFEFNQLMQSVGDEEEDKEIKVESDDEEESANENHVIVID